MIALLARTEMMDLIGGMTSAGCVGAVIGISLSLLGAATVTAGAGLAIAGAYAPLLAAFCG